MKIITFSKVWYNSGDLMNGIYHGKNWEIWRIFIHKLEKPRKKKSKPQ